MKCPKPLRFIGLDVHKKWIEVCALNARGRVLFRSRFPATPEQLQNFTRALRRTDWVALEATLNTWAIVALLERHAGRVVVSNPLQTKAIASAKIKTDKVDAAVLGHLLRCGYLPEVWRPDDQTRQWRQQVRFRDRFARRRTQLKNQIHSIFHQNLRLFEGSDLFGPGGRRWITKERATLPEHDRFELDLLLSELDHNDQHLQNLAGRLAGLGYNHPTVRLLMTIPGVDYLAALSLLAAIGDITRFPSAKHLASYFGLVSRVSQSGDHCYTGRITKRGRSHGRWIAIQSAQLLCRAEGPLRHFYLKIKKRKCHNVAVVAVARKLLTLVWHMLTKGEPYRYSVPRTTDAKFARLRLLATGEKKKSGVPVGTPRSANYGTGRSVKFAKSLNQVYAENRLPKVEELPRGEKTMLAQRGLRSWAIENLNAAKPVVRTQGTKTPKAHVGEDKEQIHFAGSRSAG